MSCIVSGPDPLNRKVLTLFTEMKSGRLVGNKLVYSSHEKTKSPGDCAKMCHDLPTTKCMSFNYDFISTLCELLEGIEGHHHKLQTVRFTSSMNILISKQGILFTKSVACYFKYCIQ